MRFPRTLLVLLLSGALAASAGACVVEEGTGENPTTTTGLVPNDSPGAPGSPEPGPGDDGGSAPDDPGAGGGTPEDPGAGVGGGQTNN